METFYPELAATNSPERFAGRWTFTIRSMSGFNLAYLTAALVAATDFHRSMDALPAEAALPGLHSDAGALEELYAFDALPDLDVLAEAQGVSPTTDVKSLATDYWPDGESVEDFIAAAMEGRHGEEDEPDS
jgi:hypothetical protein